MGPERLVALCAADACAVAGTGRPGRLCGRGAAGVPWGGYTVPQSVGRIVFPNSVVEIGMRAVLMIVQVDNTEPDTFLFDL
ncbi:hypothetical protein [Mycetohabitans endofungorum]|uniref:hypothetical protein n=1 Tax=Mycetohabitans endofungorum TaxID=417203 RepID=UPI001304CDC6|nr:hypothetical protein [Mycetohabitans endofungorum]